MSDIEFCLPSPVLLISAGQRSLPTELPMPSCVPRFQDEYHDSSEKSFSRLPFGDSLSTLPNTDTPMESAPYR